VNLLSLSLAAGLGIAAAYVVFVRDASAPASTLALLGP
jgi:hypothetical protein